MSHNPTHFNISVSIATNTNERAKKGKKTAETKKEESKLVTNVVTKMRDSITAPT